MGLPQLISALDRQIDFVLWCFLSFLDEGMQQHHRPALQAEKHPGHSIFQSRTEFPQAVAQALHQRRADRPAVLQLEHVIADRFGVFFRSHGLNSSQISPTLG